MRYRATLLVLVAFGVLGCGGSDDVLPQVRTPAPLSEDGTGPESPAEPDSAGGPGVYEGEVDGANVSVDLSDSPAGLAGDAAALVDAVDGAPMTFVVATIDNDGDAPVVLESVEITDETEMGFSLGPAVAILRDLRSGVDPYDTETYERATQLLESAELQATTVAPGEATEHLLVTEGVVADPVDVAAVGSFGRVELQRS